MSTSTSTTTKPQPRRSQDAGAKNPEAREFDWGPEDESWEAKVANVGGEAVSAFDFFVVLHLGLIAPAAVIMAMDNVRWLTVYGLAWAVLGLVAMALRYAERVGLDAQVFTIARRLGGYVDRRRVAGVDADEGQEA